MGSKPASGELAKAVVPLFGDIPEAHVIHDDVVVAAPSQEQHDKALHKVLQIIQDNGMTLNPSKCEFRKQEIPFWGMVIGKDGIKPDPEKIKCLKEASRPDSKADVMSFLCFIQSFGDFIPNLSRQTSALCKLTKKGAHFRWSRKCDKQFRKLKECIQEDTLIRHYDPAQPTYILVDAHRTGLSAILAQGKNEDTAHPVAFASRATRPEERRYP